MKTERLKEGKKARDKEGEGLERTREQKMESKREELEESSVAFCVNDHYVGECVACLWSETNK